MFPEECCHKCVHYEEEGADEYGTGLCELRQKEKAPSGYCELFWNEEWDLEEPDEKW